MVTVKWETFSEVDPERGYFAYAGYAERNSMWSYFRFLMRARKVQNQLNTTKGLIGFTARLGFLNKEVVQLAVFQDENALKEFAHSGEHAICMKTTKSDLRFLKQTSWNIAGSDVPPKIDEAVDRIQSQK